MRINKVSLDTRVMNCKSLEHIKKEKRKLLIIIKTKKLIVGTLEWKEKKMLRGEG